MDFSRVKLIAADMDGTLLNSKHQLNSEFYELFPKLKTKNILFCAASGRQYANIYNQFNKFHNEIIFIAENGSYVVYDNKQLLLQAMEHAETKRLLHQCQTLKDIYIILCGRKTAYIDNTTPEFVDRVKLYYDKVEVVDSLLNIEDDDFLKIAICDLLGTESNSYHLFKDQQDKLQVKISGKIWLDLSHKLANKGRALNFIQEKFSVTSKETMAFGDFLNDIEMLQEAHFSFAMANAHEDVKKIARFQAASNDADGVFDILRNVVK